MKKLTDKQIELLSLLYSGGTVRWNITPGTDRCDYFLEKKNDHRNLDGRTVIALEKRGFLRSWGHGWDITEAGRVAYAKAKHKEL